ncbi:DUF3347 domain-containing protein [Salinimicrobium soli]|uniref:DUF3347 domain-containing protein n=1 Tax=Salinimicrobium soli TaxID=1254399 RepID=UPI003AAB5CC7
MFASGVIEKSGAEQTSALSIPKSAVLWTGKRSVVYIKEGTESNPAFVMHQVVLGPSLGNAYVVEEGLSAGEEIVVNGTFTVDAAAQLAGKPSMMNPPTKIQDNKISAEQEDVRAYLNNSAYDFRGVASKSFQQQLDRLVQTYLQLKDALVVGDMDASNNLSREFKEQVEKTSPEDLTGEAKIFWEEKQSFLRKHAQLNLEAEDLAGRRENFIYLSQAMIKTVSAFGLQNKKIYVDYCPMANSNKGAYWLSGDPAIKNPYYGEAMLTCGEIVTELR